MKTKKITKLKKDLLIVELPEDNWITVFSRLIWICNRETNEYHHIKGSYTLLGSPDEIKEDDVEDLVEIFDLSFYVDYNHPNPRAYTFTALESCNSALESEIYWQNPHGKEEPKCIRYGTSPERIKNLDWRVAQEKTFDKKRILIFVKN